MQGKITHQGPATGEAVARSMLSSMSKPAMAPASSACLYVLISYPPTQHAQQENLHLSNDGIDAFGCWLC